ncbi:hypothetical protein SAMN05518672_106195 [Chitinophaga sp. CF118]|nr:hypothetical protein SAMN05518672_106195 [Chitinophaga sp. CF118]
MCENFFISTRKGLEKFNKCDIHYIESNGRHAKIETTAFYAFIHKIRSMLP